MPCEKTPFVLHGGHEGRAFLRRYDPDQVLRSGVVPSQLASSSRGTLVSIVTNYGFRYSCR